MSSLPHFLHHSLQQPCPSKGPHGPPLCSLGGANARPHLCHQVPGSASRPGPCTATRPASLSSEPVCPSCPRLPHPPGHTSHASALTPQDFLTAGPTLLWASSRPAPETSSPFFPASRPPPPTAPGRPSPRLPRSPAPAPSFPLSGARVSHRLTQPRAVPGSPTLPDTPSPARGARRSAGGSRVAPIVPGRAAPQPPGPAAPVPWPW